MDMDIEGQVVKGLGEGAFYVEKYRSYFLDTLGFEPFLGTLNVRVASLPPLTYPLTITPAAERGLFPVQCRDIIINNKVRGALVRPVKTAHQKEVLEIIAAVNLRERFSLQEGDTIRIRVV